MDFLRYLNEKTLQHFLQQYATFEVSGLGQLQKVRFRPNINGFFKGSAFIIKAGYAEKISISTSAVNVEDAIIILGPRYRKFKSAAERSELVEMMIASSQKVMQSIVHPFQKILDAMIVDMNISRLQIRYETEQGATVFSLQHCNLSAPSQVSMAWELRGIKLRASSQAQPIIPDSLWEAMEEKVQGVFTALDVDAFLLSVKHAPEMKKIINPFDIAMNITRIREGISPSTTPAPSTPSHSKNEEDHNVLNFDLMQHVLSAATVVRNVAADALPPGARELVGMGISSSSSNTRNNAALGQWKVNIKIKEIIGLLSHGTRSVQRLTLPRCDWNLFDGLRPVPEDGVHGRWQFIRQVVKERLLYRFNNKRSLKDWLNDRRWQRRYLKLYTLILESHDLSITEKKEKQIFELREPAWKVARLRLMAERQLCFFRENGNIRYKHLWETCEPSWNFGEMDLMGNLSRTYAQVPIWLRNVDLNFNVDLIQMHWNKEMYQCTLHLPHLRCTEWEVSLDHISISHIHCPYLELEQLEIKITIGTRLPYTMSVPYYCRVALASTPARIRMPPKTIPLAQQKPILPISALLLSVPMLGRGVRRLHPYNTCNRCDQSSSPSILSMLWEHPDNIFSLSAQFEKLQVTIHNPFPMEVSIPAGGARIKRCETSKNWIVEFQGMILCFPTMDAGIKKTRELIG